MPYIDAILQMFAQHGTGYNILFICHFTQGAFDTQKFGSRDGYYGKKAFLQNVPEKMRARFQSDNRFHNLLICTQHYTKYICLNQQHSPHPHP